MECDIDFPVSAALGAELPLNLATVLRTNSEEGCLTALRKMAGANPPQCCEVLTEKKSKNVRTCDPSV